MWWRAAAASLLPAPVRKMTSSSSRQVGDGVRGGQRALGEHHPPDVLLPSRRRHSPRSSSPSSTAAADRPVFRRVTQVDDPPDRLRGSRAEGPGSGAPVRTGSRSGTGGSGRPGSGGVQHHPGVAVRGQTRVGVDPRDPEILGERADHPCHGRAVHGYARPARPVAELVPSHVLHERRDEMASRPDGRHERRAELVELVRVLRDALGDEVHGGEVVVRAGQGEGVALHDVDPAERLGHGGRQGGVERTAAVPVGLPDRIRVPGELPPEVAEPRLAAIDGVDASCGTRSQEQRVQVRPCPDLDRAAEAPGSELAVGGRVVGDHRIVALVEVPVVLGEVDRHGPAIPVRVGVAPPAGCLTAAHGADCSLTSNSHLAPLHHAYRSGTRHDPLAARSGRSSPVERRRDRCARAVIAASSSSTSSSVLAAVTCTRKPTEARGTRGYAARVT